MDIYVLDSLYRRVALVDRYESFIWTERFNLAGDFVLSLAPTRENRNLFVTGTLLSIYASARVMKVETVQATTNEDGKSLLTLTGTSFEKILEDRIARAALSDLTTTPKWIITDDPAAIARKLFHDICVTGVLDPGDIIPGIIEGSAIFPDDTLPEPTEVITYEIEPQTLYQAELALCQAYGMGFRIIKNLDTSQLYFDVYMGSDRTSRQTDLPAIIFSPQLNNMANTNELTTISTYKNVAYVLSPVGHEVVYALDIDPEIEGFERRVLLVKADDITDVVPADATAKMIQRGKDELAKHRKFSGFDGEASQNTSYVYGQDYYLGDLVETRNDNGFSTYMQVTEQILISDANGEQSYPTLTVNTFITPGSWLDAAYNRVWDDFDDDEYWADQP